MLEQISYGSIEITATVFRLSHLVRVIYIIVSAKRAHKPQKEFLRFLHIGEQHISSDESASIDKRIARDAVLIFQLHERIESRARRFLAYSLPKVRSHSAQSDGESKDLRDTLYREFHVGVPYHISLSVYSVETNSELVRIYISQSRDIISLFAL